MAKVYGDRWEIIESLPGGGQADIFLVRDRTGEENAPLVLKRNKNPRRELRFRNEVESIQKLDHRNIIRLIDFDTKDEKPWYVQEYYPDGDLKAYVGKAIELSWKTAFDIFYQICEALAYCHNKGVFHRDLKPANVFLDQKRERVVVGDFGLAWIPKESDRATTTTEAVGSPHYMAPEYRNGRVDEPTSKGDVYSLGKVLYFLLSGGLSFELV